MQPWRFPFATFGLAAFALALGFGSARAEPDITGMWQYDFSRAPGAPRTPPAVTPKIAAMEALRRAASQKGYVRSLSNMKCLPTGMPQLMTWRSPIEIMQGFGRISILTEHDPGNDEPRTIYLNEHEHPKDLAPSWNGHSIGHWDGQVLVVDTVAMNDLVGGAPRTEASHIVERFHLAQGGKVLLDDMTLEDPQVLTKPYTMTLKFNRLPNTEERLEAVCEPDLEAMQKLDIEALKAFDIEAQHMTDPTQRYNPGGK
jgi:hypothetical protein